MLNRDARLMRRGLPVLQILLGYLQRVVEVSKPDTYSLGGHPYKQWQMAISRGEDYDYEIEGYTRLKSSFNIPTYLRRSCNCTRPIRGLAGTGVMTTPIHSCRISCSMVNASVLYLTENEPEDRG